MTVSLSRVLLYEISYVIYEEIQTFEKFMLESIFCLESCWNFCFFIELFSC
jgi:hypothetical protein